MTTYAVLHHLLSRTSKLNEKLMVPSENGTIRKLKSFQMYANVYINVYI
jgi:hypothetical protein